MDNKKQQRNPDISAQAAGDADDTAVKDSARKQKAHQKAITWGLQKFFDSVAAEPVPDEFMALLRKMDEGGPKQ